MTDTKEKQRTLVIADIHGCYEQLVDLLAKAKYDGDKDLLVFTGDYIDRGYDSFKVVKHIQMLQQVFGRDRVIALRGNHEQMLLDQVRDTYLYNDDIYKWDYDNTWAYNGGDVTKLSYIENNARIYDDVYWFRSLPTHHEDKHFIYVHAGLNPFYPLDKQPENDKLWIREKFYYSPFCNFGKPIIFGHTPTDLMGGKGFKPVKIFENYGIDTGCVFGGYLTALEIIDGTITKFYQVDGFRRKPIELTDGLEDWEVTI